MKKLIFALFVFAQLMVASDSDNGLSEKEAESDILSTLTQITKTKEDKSIRYLAYWKNGDTDCADYLVTGFLMGRIHCTRSWLCDDGSTDMISLAPSHYAFLKKLYKIVEKRKTSSHDNQE